MCCATSKPPVVALLPHAGFLSETSRMLAIARALEKRGARTIIASHGGSFVPPVLDRGLCPVPVNPPRPELARLPRFVQRGLVNHVPRWLKAPVRDLNRIADEFGIPGLPTFMALFCGDLTMVTDVPEILGISRDELENWRPWPNKLWPSTTFRYTGPLFAKLECSIPPRVEALLRAEGPIVYLVLASVVLPFLRDVIKAVAATGFRVLVGATIHEARDLETERVMIEGLLPNHIVMGMVSACVIMGGQGSVQTAMTCGTPFVGMPYHGEQELNVALAESQGMAIRLSPEEGGTPRMTEAVKRLLMEPDFGKNAQRVTAALTCIDSENYGSRFGEAAVFGLIKRVVCASRLDIQISATELRCKDIYSGIDGADGCARAILEYIHGGPNPRAH